MSAARFLCCQPWSWVLRLRVAGPGLDKRHPQGSLAALAVRLIDHHRDAGGQRVFDVVGASVKSTPGLVGVPAAGNHAISRTADTR